MPLDLEIASMLDQMGEQPAITESMIPLIREGMAVNAAMLPHAEVGAVSNLDANGVPVRLYMPAGQASPALMVFLHGGGFMLGNLDTHDAMCRQLVADSNIAVAAVEYRLAPEHRFPIPLDDCDTAYCWLRDNAAALGCDAFRVALGGESAGANLTAALAIRLRARGEAQPLFQLLIHPVTDMRFVLPSLHEVIAPGFTPEYMALCRDLYIRDPGDIENPEVSPMLCATHDGLAPAIVLTAQEDPLRDDGEFYALRLASAGVEVLVQRLPGLPHGFLFLPTTINAVRKAYSLVAKLLVRYFNDREN